MTEVINDDELPSQDPDAFAQGLQQMDHQFHQSPEYMKPSWYNVGGVGYFGTDQ
ncbi:hypothetical protein SCUCBS95973_009674 [Sporothrix curviconia]|uniref:Uncharacterized protein n=1 Tax=Sporothrix curviconia TaxID=1260050 RepID=A0ABP0CX30_9PEZI